MEMSSPPGFLLVGWRGGAIVQEPTPPAGSPVIGTPHLQSLVQFSIIHSSPGLSLEARPGAQRMLERLFFEKKRVQSYKSGQVLSRKNQDGSSAV